MQLTRNRVAEKIIVVGVLAAALMAAYLLAAKPVHASTTFTVTNTNDSGPGSLRQAMYDANSTTGADNITFSIPGSGVKTIAPDSELPNITDEVVINGYTQTGASPNTLAVGNNADLKIELSGASAPSGANGLQIGAANSTVKGLLINGWDSGVRMGGNDATGNIVMGNYIGTDASGTKDLGNLFSGVSMVDAPNNIIGGTTAGARNIIAFNGNGVDIQGFEATGNIVMGNYIGTDASGTKDLGATGDGVRISAPNNTIGGTTAGARNVISANDEGVVLLGNMATGNRIAGNYIGTDASGTMDLGNDTSGVSIVDAPNNTIGGTVAGARNIIAFNGESGVGMIGESATGNRVLSNSTFSTLGPGIDLGFDGATANDPGDSDMGPNNLQNKPVLSSARKGGTGTTTVRGTLKSIPDETFKVQLFSNPGRHQRGQNPPRPRNRLYRRIGRRIVHFLDEKGDPGRAEHHGHGHGGGWHLRVLHAEEGRGAIGVKVGSSGGGSNARPLARRERRRRWVTQYKPEQVEKSQSAATRSKP